MSKFIKLLEQTMDATDAEPAAMAPIPAAGPAADLTATTPDDLGVSDPERRSLIKLARDAFFFNPDESSSSGQFDRLFEILKLDTTIENADEQLAAIKQILRDHIDADTEIKSSADGSIER